MVKAQQIWMVSEHCISIAFTERSLEIIIDVSKRKPHLSTGHWTGQV